MNDVTMNSKRFAVQVPIRFAHCDPAGIIFFPQYLVLFNGLVEDWFDQALGVSYAHMLQTDKVGLPIVHLECDFRAITRMGERVNMGLSIRKLGNRSLTLALDCTGPDGQLRVAAQKVLVFTSLQTHQAINVPSHIRQAMERWSSSSNPSENRS
ncbi:acyl-CoA thioesterase [Comamonas suwonensis]|uniref:acyl-CoA thioesterase n=1 Tax=Comamonas suwonensis TaxID=2606214 RepID=UPI00145E38B7|nr:thioesterase family protein [Comamonas suwonensis]MBI1624566.1 acyl-CoA thioesterase [Comamonas suwonensis]